MRGTTITVEIKRTPGLFEIVPAGTGDRHSITITRSTKTQALAAMIAELFKVGGEELKVNFALAQALLTHLTRKPPTVNEPRSTADILKDVNPA